MESNTKTSNKERLKNSVVWNNAKLVELIYEI